MSDSQPSTARTRRTSPRPQKTPGTHSSFCDLREQTENSVAITSHPDTQKQDNKTPTVKRTYRVALQYRGVTGEEKIQLKQTVAARIRELCAEVTELCLTQATKATDLVLTTQATGTGTHRAARLAEALQDRSNIGQSAYLALVQATKGYKDTVKKLELTKAFFRAHPREWVSFLYFGRSPYAETRLAAKWRVKRTYARNFLVGVRNKLDNILPNEFQQGTPLPDIVEEVFKQAGYQVLNEVTQRIQARRARKNPVDKALTFMNKVQKLVDATSDVVPMLTKGAVTIGWKSLKHRSQEVATSLSGRAKRYHSALRAVMSLAVPLTLQVGTVPTQSLGVDILTPQHCLGRPFSRYHRSSTAAPDAQPSPKLQPIHLVMGAKYVIQRPGNYGTLTELFKAKGSIPVVIPKTLLVPGHKRRRPVTVHIPASHKIKQILQQGAKLVLIRIMPPTGPSQKICIDLIFEGPPQAFTATKHLKGSVEIQPPPFDPPRERVTHMGTDANRPSEYILAYYPQAPVSKFLRTLCQTYLDLKIVIRSYHRMISLAEQDGNVKRTSKLRCELQLVYDRRANLLKEIYARCSMELGWQLQRTGAQTLVIEGLAVDPSGTRRALAEAIYAMPDDQRIFARAVLNVTASRPNQPVRLEVASPRGTSQIHVDCGGRLKRSKTHYDIAPCSACDQLVNTHENAAQAVVYIAQGRPLVPEL